MGDTKSQQPGERKALNKATHFYWRVAAKFADAWRYVTVGWLGGEQNKFNEGREEKIEVKEVIVYNAYCCFKSRLAQ